MTYTDSKRPGETGNIILQSMNRFGLSPVDCLLLGTKNRKYVTAGHLPSAGEKHEIFKVAVGRATLPTI
jgi:hypothetical protein